MVVLLEQLPYPGQPFCGVIEHGDLARGGRILLEAGHFQILLQHQTAVVQRQFAGNHLHQGGLARPVATHQTEALARSMVSSAWSSSGKSLNDRDAPCNVKRAMFVPLLLMKNGRQRESAPFCRQILLTLCQPALQLPRVKGQPSSRPAPSCSTGMRTR